MTMDFLRNWYKDNVSADEDGKFRGTGIGAAILKPFVDEQSIESGMQQGAVKRTLTAAGENPADYNLGPGATIFDAQGAVVSQRRDRARKEKEGDREHAAGVLEASLKPQREQIAATLEGTKLSNQTQLEALRQQIASSDKKSGQQLQLQLQQGNQQMQLATAQLAQGNNQFLAQMADTKDQRAAELEIRKMEMDREDSRYNESLDRQESRDRKANIAALVQGIASLGAAFAM